MDFVSSSPLLTPQHISTLLGGAALTAILCALGTAIYNLYFHPLRNYPGPKFYAASRLPYALDLWRGQINRTVVAAHKQYGEVVRIAPDELSFISGETAWQDIYGFRGGKKAEFGKDLHWYSPSPNNVRSMLSTTRENHSRVRRIFSHAFSDKALRDQEPLIQRYISLLVQRLREKAEQGVDVDVVRYYNFTTFDVIADLTFGESFGCLESDDYHALVRGAFASIQALSFKLALRYYKPIEKAYYWWNKNKPMGNVIFFNFTAGKVERRLGMETARPDVVTAVQNQPESKAISTEELKSNSALFLIAGSETTATMLSGTTYALLKSPDVLKKLCEEVRGAFKSSDEITFERVNHLPYLLAVLNEGLRMYPPVPTGFPRKVPDGGETISGHFVPDNTSVYVSQYATYHSELNFAEPDSFIPERWLDNDPRFENDKKSVLMPFSNGPRNCLGKNLAYAEMRCILAKVIFNFDLELIDQKKNWFDQKVFTLWEKGPLLIKIKEARR